MPFDAFDILSYGVSGLGFLLAVLAYRLLTREQNQTEPRSNVLRSIYIFMGFSLLLCVLGISGQVLERMESLPDRAEGTMATDRFIVVLESLETISEARVASDRLEKLGFDPRIYRTKNGMFATTLPAASRALADQLKDTLVRQRVARDDAFVSSGNNMIERVID